jgi:hypothetical protein
VVVSVEGFHLTVPAQIVARDRRPRQTQHV